MAEMMYVFGDALTGKIIQEIPCQGVSMTSSLDGSDFRGTIHLDQTGKDNDTLVAVTVPGRCFVVAQRDQQVVGDFIITNTTYQSQAKSMQLYGKSWKAYPYMRVADFNYTATNADQIQIFLDLYRKLQEDPNALKVILPAFQASGELRTVEVKSYETKSYGQIIDNIANAEHGFDWRVDTVLNLNTYQRFLRFGYPTLGSSLDNASRITFEYPGNIINYWETTSIGGRAGTHLYSVGSGEGDKMLLVKVVHQDLINTGFPRYDVDTSHKDVTNLNTLTAIAVQEAIVRKPPMPIITAEVKGDIGIEFGSYNIGDACEIIIQDPRHPTGFTKQTRILGWEYYPPASDNVELARLIFEGDDEGVGGGSSQVGNPVEEETPQVEYTYKTFSNPNRTEVILNGTTIAVFTWGSKTVTILGPQRTFIEQKASFLDAFDRAVTNKWGTSPGGGVWGHFGGVDANYSASGGVGVMEVNTTNTSRYVRLNDVVSSYDGQVKIQLSTTPLGAGNAAAFIGGWQSTTDHMRYRLTFNPGGDVIASIAVNIGGTETILATAGTIATGFVGGDIWNIRAIFDGIDSHQMYAWKQGDPVPSTPTVATNDSTYLTGRLGVRGFTSTGATNSPIFNWTNFQVNAATWATRPKVSHKWWVRLLDSPYNGLVDTVWLENALQDTSTDILGIAMEFITGDVTNADYGPLYAPGRSWDTGHADDGTRQEGSDFNDFLGVTWNYPGGVTDANEVHQLGALDCSGFVRMVFGYRTDFKIPVTLDDQLTFTGENLPRTSFNQSNSGPGVVVASSVGSPPSLTQIRPGDFVAFDADTSDPNEEEGQIDHTGIYLGQDDVTGAYRFISSRKTANGPTFGDLGGESRLDGGVVLYSRSLRKIRRF